jgi:galactose oxidase-like protein
MPDGWARRFLRLGHASVPNCNSIAFDRSSPGLYRAVVAQFDIRMRPGNGRADGMGFALLNTAIYGNTGPVAPEAPLFVAEEPTFEGSLGVGFDIHKADDRPAEEPSDNHVSIHFNRRLVAAYPVDKATLDLASGQPIRVVVVARLGHGLSDVLVALLPLAGGAPVVLPQTQVPGLEPYESRAYFGARSGGESAEQDLDNVTIRWLGLPDPARYGAWGPVMPWPTVPIHMHLLPTGKVMFWDRHGDGVHPDFWDGHPRTWDPVSNAFEMTAEPTYDIFCSGHSFLEDGRLFVSGGHILDNVGQETASSYDPFTNTWTGHHRMHDGRWYPTNTALATGEILVTSGDIDVDPVTHESRVNELPQIFQPQVDPPLGAWRDLQTARRRLPLYPWMFQAPDGRAFYAGPGADTAFLDLSGTGRWIPFPTIPNHTDFRGEGSAVLWGAGKILTMGGGGGAAPALPTNRAETIDLTDPGATWVETSPMAFPRRYLTPTLLPDGKVLVTGGSSLPGISTAGAVMVPEQWDPQTRSWSLLAGMYEPRLYHSNALLLPDGRVLVAGGGHPDSNDQHIDHNNAQLYYPPYLFKGARPTIASAPSRVEYGTTFAVGTAQAGSIAKALLIRLGSVTHTFNQEQRTVPLVFSTTAGGLNVAAPGDPNLCPPGYYMLFIVDDQGIPSVARILSVNRTPPAEARETTVSSNN